MEENEEYEEGEDNVKEIELRNKEDVKWAYYDWRKDQTEMIETWVEKRWKQKWAMTEKNRAERTGQGKGRIKVAKIEDVPVRKQMRKDNDNGKTEWLYKGKGEGK